MNAEERKTDSRGHVKWSKHDRRRLMEEYRRSGKTKKEFCGERGIKVGTFYGWHKKAGKRVRRREDPSGPAFREINIPVSPSFVAEIALPCGSRVYLRDRSRQEDLIRLIRGVCGC